MVAVHLLGLSPFAAAAAARQIAVGKGSDHMLAARKAVLMLVA